MADESPSGTVRHDIALDGNRGWVGSVIVMDAFVVEVALFVLLFDLVEFDVDVGYSAVDVESADD